MNMGHALPALPTGSRLLKSSKGLRQVETGKGTSCSAAIPTARPQPPNAHAQIRAHLLWHSECRCIRTGVTHVLLCSLTPRPSPTSRAMHAMQAVLSKSADGVHIGDTCVFTRCRLQCARATMLPLLRGDHGWCQYSRHAFPPAHASLRSVHTPGLQRPYPLHVGKA